MTLLAAALAFALTQAGDGGLPGAGDTTFEQRWNAMIVLHQMRKEQGKITSPRTDKEEHVRPRKHAHQTHHRTSGCRYGTKTFTRGKSWVCKR